MDFDYNEQINQKIRAFSGLKRSLKWLVVLSFLVAVFFIWLFIWSLIYTPDFTKMRTSVVVPIYLPNGQKISRTVGPKTPTWIPLKWVSRHLLTAIIASEDAAFYSHEGVDFYELKESIKKDWKEKRFARGGSTITQQVIKNTYLSREKSIFRKVKEIILARKLEKVLTKSEILTFYVNLVEWGPGIYGIGAASQHYFGVTPIELSVKQSAFLALLLPSPIKYYVYFKKKDITPWANQRMARILRVMARMGHLNEDTYHAALGETLFGESTLSDSDLDKMIPEDADTLDTGGSITLEPVVPKAAGSSKNAVDLIPESIVPPEEAEEEPAPEMSP